MILEKKNKANHLRPDIPLWTVSGWVPLSDSLLNFHAKMSQYDIFRVN